jgi:hypothetical protein
MDPDRNPSDLVHRAARRAAGYAQRIKAIALTITAFMLFGCTPGGLDTARAACAVERPPATTGFDPEREPLGSLLEAASAAQEAAVLAEQAASQNDRWSILADASRAIASFADVLVAARMEGVAIDEATTPLMWDQAKLATAAFADECRKIPS